MDYAFNALVVGEHSSGAEGLLLGKLELLEKKM